MQRILRFNDLKPAGVVYTRKHIRDLENRGEFPMHVDLGPNSVGWVAEEVDAWVERRIRARRVVPVHQRSAPRPDRIDRMKQGQERAASAAAGDG
jgi:prophage regulatory protein